MPFSCYYKWFPKEDSNRVFEIKYVEKESDKYFVVYEKGARYSFIQINSLLDIISYKNYSENDIYDSKKAVKKVYKNIIKHLGEEVIKKHFPNEKFDKDFIKSVIEKCDKLQNKDILSWDQEEEKGNGHGIDWYQVGDDETNCWDRETGGSWRIENDFG